MQLLLMGRKSTEKIPNSKSQEEERKGRRQGSFFAMADLELGFLFHISQKSSRASADHVHL